MLLKTQWKKLLGRFQVSGSVYSNKRFITRLILMLFTKFCLVWYTTRRISYLVRTEFTNNGLIVEVENHDTIRKTLFDFDVKELDIFLW